MSTSPNDDLLRQAMRQMDQAFAEDRADDVAECFTEDARLMWPENPDIVGRASIRAAFRGFVEVWTTRAWAPQRELVQVCGERAFVIGTFIEDRATRTDGAAERVFGRLVEVWSCADGPWRLELLMTGRYDETVPLPAPPDPR